MFAGCVSSRHTSSHARDVGGVVRDHRTWRKSVMEIEVRNNSRLGVRTLPQKNPPKQLLPHNCHPCSRMTHRQGSSHYVLATVALPVGFQEEEGVLTMQPCVILYSIVKQSSIVMSLPRVSCSCVNFSDVLRIGRNSHTHLDRFSVEAIMFAHLRKPFKTNQD